MSTNLERLLASGKLQCPSCAGNLHFSDDLACSACGQTFPMLGNIPVLTPDPDEMIGLWQNRFRNFVSTQQKAIQYNRQLSASPETYAPLRERLKTLTKARIDNLNTIVELMKPLSRLEPGTPPTEHTNTLGSFAMLIYLFRDWGWETDEVDELCNTVIQSLPDNLSLDSLLVLGAGACRGSLNLHNHFNCKLTVSVDIAPTLLMGAYKVITGEELNLYQIQANNVRNAEDHVSFWKLRAPRKPDNDFLYTLSDATRLPFSDSTFQAVLTPFIIDEVGEDLRTFAPRINHVLQPGGYWANYGAMAFRPGFNYTAEEVLSIVSDSGFRILKHGFSTKPHLAPRESCVRQIYDSLYFTAVKE